MFFVFHSGEDTQLFPGMLYQFYAGTKLENENNPLFLVLHAVMAHHYANNVNKDPVFLFYPLVSLVS